MPITNTLENARKLEAGGFTHSQAQALAETIESGAYDSREEVATKEFVRMEIQSLRSEIKSDMKDLEIRIAERLRNQMMWFFTVQAGLLSLAVAAIKFLG